MLRSVTSFASGGSAAASGVRGSSGAASASTESLGGGVLPDLPPILIDPPEEFHLRANRELRKMVEQVMRQGLLTLTIVAQEAARLPQLKMVTNLTHVDLSGNKFAVVPRQLRVLEQLNTLILNDNVIASLTAGELSGFAHLTQLDLSANRVPDIANDALPPSLQRLNVDNNRLHSISFACGLPRLEVLHASGNLLTVVPTSLPETLRVLTLAYNKLQHTPDLRNLRNLRQLSLRRNNLPASVVEGALMPAQLQLLNIAENDSIDDVPPSLESLVQIQIFVAYRCTLRGRLLTLSNWRTLTGLNVSHNEISDAVLTEAVRGLDRLRWLVVSFNKLTELHADVVRLPSLREVYAQGNPLKVVDWTAVHEAAAGHLRFLDVSECPSLRVPKMLNPKLRIVTEARPAELRNMYTGAAAAAQAGLALAGTRTDARLHNAGRPQEVPQVQLSQPLRIRRPDSGASDSTGSRQPSGPASGTVSAQRSLEMLSRPTGAGQRPRQ